MVYYKVKDVFDQYPIDHRDTSKGVLIGGELYTEKEFEKFKTVPPNAVEKIELSKNKTFILFGARFGPNGRIKQELNNHLNNKGY